ncbi:MAG: FAD-dependent oxidoreductase [Proteobacteria bacterium]|nr:FAD-dependent oxidoreductase [Pseudomonadota bacterium]
MGKNKKIVVIGGVACGPKVAARIKRLNPKAEVTIVEKGELLSYAGCGLPFYISGEVHDHNELMATPTGVVRDTLFFNMVKDIHVMNHTLAKSVDPKRKIVCAVRIDTGECTELDYDALVLAVGSKNFKPPVPGLDLKGVHFLQTVEDAQKIRNKSGDLKGKHGVIIGAGLIGIEVTEAFKKQGMDVTMIERAETVLPDLLDPEMAFHIHQELKANGITLKLNETVLEILGDDQGNVISVKTSSGKIKADIVLVAVGVRPNVRLAKEMGLELGETGAIKVDQFLRTSDPSIYAGGDCVENANLVNGKAIYAPMGSTANKHGRVIADHICGVETPFRGVSGTAICKLFNLNISRTGLTEKQAMAQGYDVITVLNPSPDKAHFLKDARMIIIKFVVEKLSAKVLGAQIVGPGDVAKRMDVTVATIAAGRPVTDIAHLDLAYAPPFSPAMDNIITAANMAENKLKGIGLSYSPLEVKAKMDKGEAFIFLDVRSPLECEVMRIDDPRIVNIPLGKLRSSLALLPKDKEIIPFCKISLRGYEAQRVLVGEGYTQVKYMDGGLVCWPYEKTVNS